MSGRLNVGLMIHHLENDYSKALVKGAAEAAEALDVNIIFYPGRSLGGTFHDAERTVYEYQNNVLYNFISPASLDGLIVSAGTVGQFVSKEEFKSFIDCYEGMPVLTLENEVRGYPCLRYGSDGIKLVINHLCSEHGCRSIAFVSGPKSNEDAQSRLAAYREAMLENGLDYDESMIAYGNFSEFSEEAVNSILDNSAKKPDAICFANDQMCIGGYNACRARGLEPGKDILITGYDDSEVAKSLSPMLTTVKADASALGYAAVERLVSWIGSGEAPNSEELPSGLVIRNSCGCEIISADSSKLEEIVRDMSSEDAAATVVNILSGSNVSVRARNAKKTFSDFLAELFNAASGGGELPEAKLINAFQTVVESGVTECIGHDVAFNILEAALKVCIRLAGSQHGKLFRLHSLFSKFTRCISDYLVGWYYSQQTDNALCTFLIGNIAKDMIMFMDDEERCFNSITNNLYRLHIRSSYIYEYEMPIINPRNSQWVHPERLMLKAYHIGDQLMVPPKDEQAVPSDEYIDNKFSPKDTRRTMVLAALYSNDEQYGILLCDLDPRYFSFIYSTAPQVCTAIKLTGLIRRLEGSLIRERDTNTMLNKISMSDELTGVFNRRGFYKYANIAIRRPENEGRTGVLIFGDLDNLKKINDTFGHDDGDYAIKTAAGYLKNSVPDGGVAARIGGDEFAAFAVSDEDPAGIAARIKNAAAEHNRTSEKVYNVCISVGVYTFTCSEDKDIQKYMDKADSALYKDKKNKSFDIMKKDAKI